MHKDDVQKRNADKLQRMLEEEKVPEFIQKYIKDFDSKSSSINYWIAIRDLLQYLIDTNVIKRKRISDIIPKDLNNVEAVDVSEYLRDKEQNGMQPTTLYTRRNIFKSFWRYLVITKKCPVNVNIIDQVSYKGVSTNNNLTEKLPSDEQIAEMEKRIMKKKDAFVRIRNIMILRVLKGTGIRESELAGLSISDLHLGAQMPYIKVLGKGKRHEKEKRTVYLTDDAKQAIKEWLKERKRVQNIIDKEAVFLNKNGRRLSENNIIDIFNTYGGGITPHMMRHWYGTVMVKIGGIAFAQQQLGHSDPSITTNFYANGSYGMEEVLKNM